MTIILTGDVLAPLVHYPHSRAVHARRVQQRLRQEQLERFLALRKGSLRERGIVPVGAIVKIVADAYLVPVREIMGRSHRRTFTNPRMAAMYLAWMSGRSLVQIGRAFDRDHTTVMNAVERIGERAAASPKFKLQIVDLYIACGGHEG